tara:strand:+ start:126 stop:797 length:672 start_codon:yes stop_codon:yes gene_type:complete
MHLRKSNKILIYFLLLLILGSINNIKLDKINFSNISNIEILGLGNENHQTLLENINNLKLGNIFFLEKEKLDNLISSNSLVEKYDIFKVYPSSLYVNIEKTKFLARLNQNGNHYIIGSNGKLSNNNLNSQSLPFIFGRPKIDEFLKFKKIIDDSKLEFREIKNFYYFASGRWDIELNNDLLIKLPDKDIDQSLKFIFDFLNNNNLVDINIVDARIRNQIILND